MASIFPAEFHQSGRNPTVTALGSFVQIYLDDILIYSKTAEEHARHLDFVFSTLRENGIYLNPKKCEFNKAEVRFLGHLVSKDGVRPDPAKVEVMRPWPVPTDRHELYRFLGFANYFRVFIRDYATIASPLYPLTQISSKEEFAGKWTQLEQDCFEAIKTALANAPTLKLPDFDIPFEVLVDASNIAVGAVLIQELRLMRIREQEAISSRAEVDYDRAGALRRSTRSEGMGMLSPSPIPPLYTLDRS
jgi:hypothetical protein